MAPCRPPRFEVLLHAIIGGLFSERLMPPGAVLDVGANDGEMAMFYACLDSSRVVHALEPNLRVFHALHRTTAPAGNIKPLRAGVSSTDHAVSYGDGTTGSTPDTLIAGNSLVVGSRSDFPVYRVDSLFTAGDAGGLFAGERVGFWHLDVEWHELEALRGAVATIGRDQPVFAAELHVHWSLNYTRQVRWKSHAAHEAPVLDACPLH